MALLTCLAAGLLGWAAGSDSLGVASLAAFLCLAVQSASALVMRRFRVGEPGAGFGRFFGAFVWCLLGRLAISFALIGAYVVAGGPIIEVFALTYAGGYMLVGYLEARALVADSGQTRRTVS